MSNDTVVMSYYTCDCEWLTKYCDEYHMARVTIPKSVLAQYRTD